MEEEERFGFGGGGWRRESEVVQQTARGYARLWRPADLDNLRCALVCFWCSVHQCNPTMQGPHLGVPLSTSASASDVIASAI